MPLLAQCNLICVCVCERESVEGWREAGEELAWLVVGGAKKPEVRI